MPSIKQKKQQQKVTDEIYKHTHFTKSEIEMLLGMYSEYLHRKKPHEKAISRPTFRDILQNEFGMTDDILMDRIFRAFDKDNDAWICMQEWICGMSIFLRGGNDEHMEFCFHVYDLNGDGFISREEMFHLLKHSLVTKSPQDDEQDEGVKDLVEISLKKMDHDHDNRVSPEDYRKTVEDDNLMMEFLGVCLPSSKHKESFEAQFLQTKTMMY